MKFTPRVYQKQDIKFLLQNRFAGLFLDPGLGKTSVVLSALRLLRDAGKPYKALIVAPLRVCANVWSASGEVGKWDDFRTFKVALLHGRKRDDAFESDADLYVVNFEGLAWLLMKDPDNLGNIRLQTLWKRGVCSLVVDELSKFKHSNTQRFKGMRPWLAGFDRRWGLTGSPAANSLLDLFGQIFILDRGQRLGQFITHYRQTYFYPSGFKGYDWKPQPGAQERIFDAIKDLVHSRRATDHLDLPDLVQENVWVDLPPEARAFYDGMEEDMIAELDGATFKAGSAGVVSGKCRQIASGGLYYDVLTGKPSTSSKQAGELEDRMQRFTKHIHDAKTEALVDLIEELQGAPLMVGIGFRHDRDRIRKALGDVPSLDGDCNEKESSKIISEWNAGKYAVLLFHPQAAGHGLNLQGCSCAHMAWYTAPWDREGYDQSIARIWRQGSHASRVIVHRILARETVDEAVVKALGVKVKTQNALFEALKDYVAERTTRCRKK